MTTLTLLQLNDLHGYLEPHPELVRTEGGWRFERLGGVARIAHLFEEARAEGPCLTLDSGDTFHGTRVAVASRGEALVPIMNALKIDAMTAHWEFAYGPAGFKALAARLEYPVLAANVFRKGRRRADVRRAMGVRARRSEDRRDRPGLPHRRQDDAPRLL